MWKESMDYVNKNIPELFIYVKKNDAYYTITQSIK